jgi:flagellar basal body-associated protein FliL
MSFMKILIIAGFVGTVILAECLVAYMMIPSTADIEAKLKMQTAAEAEAAPTTEESATKAGEEEKTAETPTEELSQEVDLGKFNLTLHRQASDVTLKVNFHLIGTVEGKKQAENKTLLEKNQHRLRDKIIFEVRNCDIADLTDPGLGLLKRRILEKCNEMLGKPVLESVVFSEFSYTQL